MLQNQTAPKLFFRVWDSSQNPVTSITIGDLSITVHRPGYADGSPVALALTTDPTSTTVGHVYHVGSGLHWVNISTASISSLQGTIVVKGTYTGGSVDGIVEAVIPAPSTFAAGSDAVTVGGYASGQSPADLVSVPSKAEIAAEVNSVLTAAHGSGSWTTAVLSSVTVGGYASGKSPAEALIDHLETQTRGKGSLSYLKMLELNTAALLGKASAPSGSTETFVYADGATDAFTVTFDANGYRTGVTIEN